MHSNFYRFNSNIPNFYISPKIGFDPTQIPGFNGESGSGISDISAGLS